MSTIEQIVQLLIQERDRLSTAIEVLQGSTKRKGRPPKSTASAFDYTAPNVPDWVKPKALQKPPAVAQKRTMSAAGRKRIAEAARKRWALIKAGKAQSPFTAHQKKKAAKKA